jgi:hypothetical protein
MRFYVSAIAEPVLSVSVYKNVTCKLNGGAPYSSRLPEPLHLLTEHLYIRYPRILAPETKFHSLSYQKQNMQ